MLFLYNNNHADFVEAFNPNSRYLDDLLNIDKMVRYIPLNFS